MIKAIIFDLDGVLVEAREWHYRALNYALNLFAYNISREDHENRFNGLPTKTKLNMLTKERGLPICLHPVISNVKQRETVRLISNECKEDYRLKQTLKAYKEQGRKLVVASNAIRSSVFLMLNKTGIHNYFDFYLGNEDVREPKPKPDSYLKAIEKLGIPAKNCIAVEDSAHGIKAAEAAGLFCCRVDSPQDLIQKIEGDSTLLDITLESLDGETNE